MVVSFESKSLCHKLAHKQAMIFQLSVGVTLIFNATGHVGQGLICAHLLLHLLSSIIDGLLVVLGRRVPMILDYFRLIDLEVLLLGPLKCAAFLFRKEFFHDALTTLNHFLSLFLCLL